MKYEVQRRIILKKKVLLRITAVLLVTLSVTAFVFHNQVVDFYQYSRAAISYYGSSGQEVVDIQSKLYNWGYYSGPVDGLYGYNTYSAVRQFQYKNGLSVDGVAGPQTLAALGLPAGTTTSSGTQGGAVSGNANLLAHLVYGEARGEPYVGQVGVAAVVLNRTRDSRFPKTIAGVIYEPGAFDAVYDGQINLEPDDAAYNAARDALNGWDPTYGCVYYYNPATATSSWIWSRPILLRIGNHNFAK
jgi:N-acetylmuramoyl-L-alanine amidase